MAQVQNASSTATGPVVLSPSAYLDNFRASYPLKPMAKKEDNADQLKFMPTKAGVRDMPKAPALKADFPQVVSPPASSSDAKMNRHLWVLRSAFMPIALEFCAWGTKLESKCIKHSNLTGGEPAYSGGEMWFIAQDRIAVNAASGRYGAKSEKEFDLIVDALRQSGYHVASAGFDIDNETVANTVFVGEPDWKAPL